MPNSDEVFRILIEISGKVSEVGTKIDGLTTNMAKHTDEDKEFQKQTEGRLRNVEDMQKRVKWMAMGMGVAVTGLWKVAEAVITTFKH